MSRGLASCGSCCHEPISACWRITPIVTLLEPENLASQATNVVRIQVARSLPDRHIVSVTDSSTAAIELLNAVCRRVCMITRLRLDARLFDPRGTIGRPLVTVEATNAPLAGLH